MATSGWRSLIAGRGLEARDLRHPDVHQDDVGRGLVDQLDRLVAVGRLAHDLVAPGQQQRGDAVAEEGVVVNEHSSHGLSLPPKRR